VFSVLAYLFLVNVIPETFTRDELGVNVTDVYGILTIRPRKKRRQDKEFPGRNGRNAPYFVGTFLTFSDFLLSLQ
jgi:hypothetical protein